MNALSVLFYFSSEFHKRIASFTSSMLKIHRIVEMADIECSGHIVSMVEFYCRHTVIAKHSRLYYGRYCFCAFGHFALSFTCSFSVALDLGWLVMALETLLLFLSLSFSNNNALHSICASKFPTRFRTFNV